MTKKRTRLRKPFTAFRPRPRPSQRPRKPEQTTAAAVSTPPAPAVSPLSQDAGHGQPANTFLQQKDVLATKEPPGRKTANKGRERGPKQLAADNNIYDDEEEPTPEPEPAHHGDPRYHAFHSCQYPCSF